MDLDFWGSFWREKVLFCRKDFTFVEESIGLLMESLTVGSVGFWGWVKCFFV